MRINVVEGRRKVGTMNKRVRVGRRQFLSTTLALGASASVGASVSAKTSMQAEAQTAADVEASLNDNIYTRVLGVRPHLGAHEHISRLSGSRMTAEVMDALIEANRYFVDMNEL